MTTSTCQTLCSFKSHLIFFRFNLCRNFTEILDSSNKTPPLCKLGEIFRSECTTQIRTEYLWIFVTILHLNKANPLDAICSCLWLCWVLDTSISPQGELVFLETSLKTWIPLNNFCKLNLMQFNSKWHTATICSYSAIFLFYWSRLENLVN